MTAHFKVPPFSAAYCSHFLLFYRGWSLVCACDYTSLSLRLHTRNRIMDRCGLVWFLFTFSQSAGKEDFFISIVQSQVEVAPFC